MITVAELIEYLKTQDQELPIAYCCMSEQVLLELNDIMVSEGCMPRPDGWIQNKRPDKIKMKYLLYLGLVK